MVCKAQLPIATVLCAHLTGTFCLAAALFCFLRRVARITPGGSWLQDGFIDLMGG